MSSKPKKPLERPSDMAANRDVNMTVRVTREELDSFVQKAKAAGQPFSHWVRSVLSRDPG